MPRWYSAFLLALQCFACLDGLSTTEGTGGAGGFAESDAAPPCEPIACHAIDPTTNTTASVAAVCNDEASAGSCVASGWDYCKCGGLPSAGLFFEPPPSSGKPLERVTLIAPKADGYSIGVDDGQYCPGFAPAGCDLVGDCAAALPDMRIYQWIAPGNLFDQPGSHTVQIYHDDLDGVPCYPATTLWLSVPYIRP
jgi:hypothetical protein